MSPIKHIAFFINAEKAGAQAIGNELLALAKAQGLTTKVASTFPMPEEFLQGVDACCAIGGDGTMLSCVRQAVLYDVPLLGVNHGKLGFLATYDDQSIKETFLSILEGKHSVHERSLLSCCTPDGQHCHALNDIVIKNNTVSRLIALEVHTAQEYVTPYDCDGLIFATPTGSTAYNLSANGPIVHPDARVLVMTPICPHTLSNRTLIFDQHRPLTVKCTYENCTPQITIDGRLTFEQSTPFPLDISLSDKSLKLIQPHDYSYFRLLRKKLHWRGSGHDNR